MLFFLLADFYCLVYKWICRNIIEDFHARTAQVHFLKFGYFDINIVRKFGMGSKNYTCVLVLCIRCWMFHLEQHKITNAFIACKHASIHSSVNMSKRQSCRRVLFLIISHYVFNIANHQSHPAQGYKCCFWLNMCRSLSLPLVWNNKS